MHRHFVRRVDVTVWGLYLVESVCVSVRCTDRCVLSSEMRKQTKPFYFSASCVGEDAGGGEV